MNLEPGVVETPLLQEDTDAGNTDKVDGGGVSSSPEPLPEPVPSKLNLRLQVRYVEGCVITPRAHARARGYVIGRGVYIYILYIVCTFFWNQSFIFQNTHFQKSL